jgi:hypothetical protein
MLGKIGLNIGRLLRSLSGFISPGQFPGSAQDPEVGRDPFGVGCGTAQFVNWSCSGYAFMLPVGGGGACQTLRGS